MNRVSGNLNVRSDGLVADALSPREAFNSTTTPLPRQTQRQDSLTDQMRAVEEAAVAMGCYDAVDWIRARWAAR